MPEHRAVAPPKTDPSLGRGPEAAGRRGRESRLLRGIGSRGSWLPLAALVTVAASVAVRLVGLDRQSYWGDEFFSVIQSRGTLDHTWQLGLEEIHPPLYAVLLDGWIHLGGGAGTHEEWTRSSSALLGLLTILAAYLILRRTPISPEARLCAVSATAASGCAIVYAQEVRPYALLLLAATGVTASTLGWLTEVDAGRRRRRLAGWTAWALLASASHMFGGILVAGLAAVMAMSVRRRRVRLELAAGLLIGLLPQAAWLLYNWTRPGFASGTVWIESPTATDVFRLLTTVLSAGHLVPFVDGFAWTAPWGVLAAAALLVVAWVLRRREGGLAGGAEEPSQGHPDLVAGAALLGAAALVVAGVFVLSRWVHIWTLRNMLVVQPAITWGIVLVVVGLPRRERHRRWLATAVVALVVAELAVTAQGLRHPYKTDFRGAVEYLAKVRTEDPNATFMFTGGANPPMWFLAADRQPTDPVVARTLSRTTKIKGTPARIDRPAGTLVLVAYKDVGHPNPDQLSRKYEAALGSSPPCHRIPIYGLVVLRCDP